VAFVNLSFPSGTIASVSLSWLAPRKVRSTVLVGERAMIVYDDTQPDEPVKIYDRGVMTADSENFGEHQLTYRYGDTVSPHVSPVEPLALEIEEFIASVESATRGRSSGWFGLEVVRALEAADASWRLSGLPVPVKSMEWARRERPSATASRATHPRYREGVGRVMADRDLAVRAAVRALPPAAHDDRAS
jgi:predicted dehydrogenase